MFIGYSSAGSRSLLKMRGMIVGGHFIGVLHFRHLLVFCYLVSCFTCFCSLIFSNYWLLHGYCRSSRFSQCLFLGESCILLIQLLLHADIASNWLACFPFTAQKHVYDIFFVKGLPTEVVQILVPFLQQKASDDLDANSVQTNTERYDERSLLVNKF